MSGHQILRVLLLGAVAVYSGRYLGLALNRWPNPDELQSLVNAFDAACGLRLYLDFWDNHGPALTWLLQPLISLWPDDHNVFFAARAAAWGCLMISTLLVYKVARAAFPRRKVLPAVAALLFLMGPQVMSHGIEIRPDNLSVVLWSGCLLSLIYGLQSGRPRWWVSAGLLLGICATFTVKVLPLGVAIVLLLAAGKLLRLNVKPKDAFAFGASFLVPVLVMLAALQLGGNLQAWVVCVIKGTAERGSSLNLDPTGELLEMAPIWFALCLFSCILAVHRLRKRSFGHEALFLGPAAFLLLQFALLLPTKFLQSLLTAQVPVSVLGAWLICEAGAWLARRMPHPFEWLANQSKTKRAVTVIGVALIVAGLRWELVREDLYYGRFYNTDASEYVSFANRTAARFEREATGFDPSGYVFMRPKPGLFHVLVLFLRVLHTNGTIDLQITELLRTADCKYVVYDGRADTLREADVAAIRASYVPVENAVIGRQPVVVAVAGRITGRDARTSAPASGRYAAWEHFRGWDRHKLGWHDAGSTITFRRNTWVVNVGNRTNWEPDSGFNNWQEYGNTRDQSEAAPQTEAPTWFRAFQSLKR